MPLLDEHRKVPGADVQVFSLHPPFSSFDFIENSFGDYDSIRRLFSLSRSSQAQTLIVESIPACGIISEENEDITSLFSTYSNTNLLRISFWKEEVNGAEISTLNNENLVGYAILKKDTISDEDFDRWHVFESVFAKYPHDHNCVPRAHTYKVRLGEHFFEIQGVLYCQQNELNKACAQVALRSLLSRVLPEEDISYRRINEIAASVSHDFNSGKGLNVSQLRTILIRLGLRFTDVDYTLEEDSLREDLPYQKYAYAGLEAGCGALIGFRLAGRELQEEAKHIIPIYGHTFNKDTWAPNADFSYFRIGEGVGYVPSESWTSSFLGHDDNFGPNFCIPRLYIGTDKVDYVVEIFRPGVMYGGVQAEVMALNILYSLLPRLYQDANNWIKRLIEWTAKQQVVFRAQALTATEYVDHLRTLKDWEGNEEQRELCDFLVHEMPEFVWVVEISTPHLFPANERKLGEIVLDATQELNTQDEFSVNNVFIFARLPGTYLLGGEVSNEDTHFIPVPSQLISHTDLIKM